MTARAAALQFLAPAGILIGASVTIPYADTLPASLADLKLYGPYFIVALGVAISIAFKRGRVLFALLTLAAAQVGRQLFLQPGSSAAMAYTTYAALCVLVPMNLAALSLAAERGIFSTHGAQRMAVLLAEIFVVAAFLKAGSTGLAAAAYAEILQLPMLARSPVPQLGLLAMALGFATALAVWFFRRSTVDVGLAAAILAFAVSASAVTTQNVYELFLAAGAVTLTVAVMQDTFNMAFRDELTGLPSRRALNERLASLGHRYTIAMIDVDRFKGLNDRFGHDVGDQVLKMVGARLMRVRGGGRAYRYGGEEFTVLFPGKSTGEALPHLEALRQDIAGYKLALRDPGRAEHADAEKKRRGEGTTGRTVAVTVSIGVAENDERVSSPEEVLQSADKALYRAKNRGRNQVSR